MASIKKRDNGKWRARYRDEGGKEHARHFDRRADAQAWLDSVTASLVRGDYVDPRAGRITLADHAERWLMAQTFEESTREAVEVRFRRHILPQLGARELKTIKPSTVQAWLRGRQEELAPRTVRVLLANLSALFGAAVDDGLISSNPCTSRSVKAPSLDTEPVEPWTAEMVHAVTEALPERYRAIAVVGAGCGLRQGEAFGLRVEDLEFLRRTVHVRQQVKIVRSRVVIDAPKRRKRRDVPLPDTVAAALSAHLAQYPVGEGGLIFTSRERKPLNRNYFNGHVWKPALESAGIDPTRKNGMHALRHYYASALLDGGANIRDLADYLGHSDPGFTLRVYTHLMPASEDRARRAIDAALGASEERHAL